MHDRENLIVVLFIWQSKLYKLSWGTVYPTMYKVLISGIGYRLGLESVTFRTTHTPGDDALPD